MAIEINRSFTCCLYSLLKMDPGPTALCVFGWIATFVQVPILTTFIYHRNVSVACLSAWILVFCLNLSLGATLWGSSDVTTWKDGKVFCDIMVRLTAGANTGAIASTTAIARNLSLASRQKWHDYMSFKNRMIDLTICMLHPMLAMAYVIFFMYPRYAIYEGYGCGYLLLWNYSVVALVLPPVLFSLVSGYYTVLAATRLIRVRRAARTILKQSGANLTLGQWWRMFGLCAVIVMVVLPLSTYQMIDTLIIPAEDYIPYVLPWRMPNYDVPVPIPNTTNPLSIAVVVLSYVMFALYGFNKQVVGSYRSVYYFTRLDRIIGMIRGSKSSQQYPDNTSEYQSGSISVLSSPKTDDNFDFDFEKQPNNAYYSQVDALSEDKCPTAVR